MAGPRKRDAPPAVSSKALKPADVAILASHGTAERRGRRPLGRGATAREPRRGALGCGPRDRQCERLAPRDDGSRASVITVRDGRIVHAVGYLTKKQAVRASGADLSRRSSLPQRWATTMD